MRSKTKVTREYLNGAPNLKLVIRGGVGLDNVDIQACRERGIDVKNTPRASSVAVAELTMALMLAVPNRLVEGHVGIKQGRFLKKELKRTELYGKTLGLVGAGLIGTEVARRAQAFGMKVLAYDPQIANHALAELVDDLDELFVRADFISFHVPATAETRGLVNEHTIAKMKDGVDPREHGPRLDRRRAGPRAGPRVRQGPRLRDRRLPERPARPEQPAPLGAERPHDAAPRRLEQGEPPPDQRPRRRAPREVAEGAPSRPRRPSPSGSAPQRPKPGPRSARPGRSAVIFPPSTTSAPFTATYGKPSEYRSGSA